MDVPARLDPAEVTRAMADTTLREIIGHLGAADIVSLPSDDQIIMGHVRTAHALALTLHKALARLPVEAVPEVLRRAV